MEISDQVFTRARKLNRPAVEELFAQVYPTTVRLARGLSGREDVADGVVRFLMGRAIKVLPNWRDATEAERWFLHHTVLTARRAATHEASAKNDLLSSDGDAAVKAFVRAIRVLPQQQREAVLLHHGEHLNARYLGVAMDCSADAAQAHLDAGRAALRTIAGADFDALIARVENAYARLKPADTEIPAAARRWANKGLRPRRLKRLVWLGFLILFIAGAIVWWRW